MTFSIKVGDFLYRRAFPLYNILYPVLKKKWDAQEIALLRQHIQTGQTVLDIGANIGFYSCLISSLVGPTGKVYSYEPDKTNFGHLRNNTRKIKNIIVHKAAISDQSGKITLYESDLLNVDHTTYPTIGSGPGYPTDSIKLDDALAHQKVDFIKIDVQGYEYFAFMGMKNILANNPKVKILSEFYPYGLTHAKCSILGFLDLFWTQGFKIFLVKAGELALLDKTMLSKYENLGRFDYFNLLIYR